MGYGNNTDENCHKSRGSQNDFDETTDKLGDIFAHKRQFMSAMILKNVPQHVSMNQFSC